jgi:alkanesulfonate monooxygenase SsuD/methylene tetrahydromethanopterin reductase-like flavin-dependent oxidoreductase (luciferase family)
MVTGIHYRHPAVLANIVATLDIVSNGRLELGIGAGWNEQESGAYGIELGGLKERHDRFDEACEVLVGLLTQDSTDFAGEYYTLTDARCEPKGPQRPHPPFVIGGGGEKRTLRTVARFAQHWNFPGGTPADLAHKRDVLHQHCADVGRDPSEIMISMHVRTPADPTASDIAKAVEETAALEQEGLQLAVIYLAPPHTPAVLEPLATAFAQLA